jgi:hypothetical protein
MAKGDVSTYKVDGVWKSKGEGSARAAHTGGTKAQQIAMGRKMAQKRKWSTPSGNWPAPLGRRTGSTQLSVVAAL